MPPEHENSGGLACLPPGQRPDPLRRSRLDHLGHRGCGEAQHGCAVPGLRPLLRGNCDAKVKGEEKGRLIAKYSSICCYCSTKIEAGRDEYDIVTKRSWHIECAENQ